MTPRGRAGWLPSALLLLQLPGCFSLSGPSRVMGIVGGSLSVECQYQEVFINNSKYWCKPPCLWRMVETRESEREVRRGRVSIRDRPANLTFTVTLESLREEDAGRYWCGIDTSWFEGMLRDPTFEVEVSVIPGEHPPPSLQHRLVTRTFRKAVGQKGWARMTGRGWAGSWLWVVSWAHVCLHTGTSLSLAGATLELHVDTVKVDIFLLHGLAGILPWNPGCLLSSQGHVHSQGARVSFWPVQGPAYGEHTLTRPHCIQPCLDPRALRT
uniref:Uncharacterized protein n=1 Tax=Ovis aries TaxID=9940 RepID=A0AC11ERH3_SHEEP